MDAERLARLLDPFPDDALVPVRWLRAQLQRPALADDGVGDLSCVDVAKLLRRKPGTIRGWCQRGEIKAYQLNGKEWRIKRADLRTYLDTHGTKRSEQTAAAVDLGSWRGK